MLKEFRDFINRGNVLDLAVAVIIGAAFGAITTSLVDDVITPIIGLILGGVDFSGLSFGLGEAQIMYGNFLQAVFDFLIIALVVFFIVRGYNRMQERFMHKEVEEDAAEATPSREAVLLEEIRNILSEQRQQTWLRLVAYKKYRVPS